MAGSAQRALARLWRRVPTAPEIRAFETRVEEASLLRAWLLAPAQRLLARLGVGNEQVYLGNQGWLFYRLAVDHVTAPGFLDPRVLERRRSGGSEWQQPPKPNPLPALLDFASQLQERDIRLLVLPTPGKVSIYPGRFVSALDGRSEAIHNASYTRFLNALELAGVDVLDPSSALLAAKRAGSRVFLETDTHWTPEGLAVTVGQLAQRIRDMGVLSPSLPSSS